MDKLLQMIVDGEELGSDGPIPGIQCISQENYLGEELHAELLAWVNLGQTTVEVLDELEPLVRCDVYDSALIFVRENTCPNAQKDLMIVGLGMSFMIGGVLVALLMIPPALRRLENKKLWVDEGLKFTRH